jgi:hypothetical protein
MREVRNPHILVADTSGNSREFLMWEPKEIFE